VNENQTNIHITYPSLDWLKDLSAVVRLSLLITGKVVFGVVRLSLLITGKDLSAVDRLSLVITDTGITGKDLCGVA